MDLSYFSAIVRKRLLTLPHTLLLRDATCFREMAVKPSTRLYTYTLTAYWDYHCPGRARRDTFSVCTWPTSFTCRKIGRILLFYVSSTARKVAGQHIAPYSQRPTLPVNVHIVSDALHHPMALILEIRSRLGALHIERLVVVGMAVSTSDAVGNGKSSGFGFG